MVEDGSILLRRMEICVAEAEKRSGKNAVSMQETFTVYLIETRWVQRCFCKSPKKKQVFEISPSLTNNYTKPVMSHDLSRPMDAVAEGRNLAPDSLWRRYSEFELLRNYLIVTYPYIVAPPLPEKRVRTAWPWYQIPAQWWTMMSDITWLLACRQSSCGTSCQQTTWTQTLWSAAESGWRTFCCVWRHTQYSPMTRFSTISSLRYMLQLWVCPAGSLIICKPVADWITCVCGRNMAGRKRCMRQDFRQR